MRVGIHIGMLYFWMLSIFLAVWIVASLYLKLDNLLQLSLSDITRMMLPYLKLLLLLRCAQRGMEAILLKN